MVSYLFLLQRSNAQFRNYGKFKKLSFKPTAKNMTRSAPRVLESVLPEDPRKSSIIENVDKQLDNLDTLLGDLNVRIAEQQGKIKYLQLFSVHCTIFFYIHHVYMFPWLVKAMRMCLG